MRAIISTSYGSPDVLELKEVAKPAVNDDEVLVSVKAATVNRTDCATLRAKPFFMRLITGLFKPNKPIPGTDFAGKIVAVGKNVKTFQVEDRVFGFDDTGLSSHAEYTTISKQKALKTIPEHTSYEQAAASLEGAHYAVNFINKVNLKSDQKVLVNGASGGNRIGSRSITKILWR